MRQTIATKRTDRAEGWLGVDVADGYALDLDRDSYTVWGGYSPVSSRILDTNQLLSIYFPLISFPGAKKSPRAQVPKVLCAEKTNGLTLNEDPPSSASAQVAPEAWKAVM